MPAPDLSSYKVAASEVSSATKFNNLVQAVQDEFGDIDPDQIPGYPADATKFLRGDGAWALPVGHVFAHDEFTSAVNITATTEGGANTIVTAGSITLDGTTSILVEFACPRLDRGTGETLIYLFDNGSSIGILARIIAAGGAPVFGRRRLTPSAAAHVYSIRGAVDAGTGVAQAGVGGSGVMVPGSIRVTKTA